MQFEWLVDCFDAGHRSQKTTDYSARGKVRGELYSVFQKSMEQLCQLIAVGCYSVTVTHFSVKETTEGSTPSNI